MSDVSELSDGMFTDLSQNSSESILDMQDLDDDLDDIDFEDDIDSFDITRYPVKSKRIVPDATTFSSTLKKSIRKLRESCESPNMSIKDRMVCMCDIITDNILYFCGRTLPDQQLIRECIEIMIPYNDQMRDCIVDKWCKKVSKYYRIHNQIG